MSVALCGHRSGDNDTSCDGRRGGVGAPSRHEASPRRARRRNRVPRCRSDHSSRGEGPSPRRGGAWGVPFVPSVSSASSRASASRVSMAAAADSRRHASRRPRPRVALGEAQAPAMSSLATRPAGDERRPAIRRGARSSSRAAWSTYRRWRSAWRRHRAARRSLVEPQRRRPHPGQITPCASRRSPLRSFGTSHAALR